jgi:hypothetical protein
MTFWQADFYKHSVAHHQGDEILWELVLCDLQGHILCEQSCPQSQVGSDWLIHQLEPLLSQGKPTALQVFRPQSLGLFCLAGEQLGLAIVATRQTKVLKQLLQKRYGPEAIELDRPPPQPLPENLWGEQWRFATLSTEALLESFCTRPIPYGSTPQDYWSLGRKLAPEVPIAGVIIYAGRQARYLCQWLAQINPVSLNYQEIEMGQSGGLMLEAGLLDRWILATFTDPEVARAAIQFEQRKAIAHHLHFLLIQPDDSGVTYTGFWLLQGGSSEGNDF